MHPILCFGDICPDIHIPYGAARRVREGELLDSEDLTVQTYPGGSVANTTVGIARQGLPVMFCGTVGDDHYGRMLYDDMTAEGADVSLFVKNRDIHTFMVLIILDRDGDRTIFALPRHCASQHQITAEQVPDGIEHRISWMHSSGITLREGPAAQTQLNLMRRCKQAGVPVSLDINARPESYEDAVFARNIAEALAYCDYIFGSAEDEIAPLLSMDDANAAVKTLAARGYTVVARAGAQGATVYAKDETHACPAFPVQVIDTVGAGDAYDAGFITALLQGHSLADANRRACATAAICVSGKGGHATPNAEELERFLSQP
ncbi:MAG: sugar kinase [Clostridiales bacterium]|nr:sugar kinase [Clostridiales bacterium]